MATTTKKAQRELTNINWSAEALHILYAITSNISTSNTLLATCEIFTHIFFNATHSTAVVVRKLTDEGWMEIVASNGVPESYTDKHARIPIDGSLFDMAHSGNTHIHKSEIKEHFPSCEERMLTVPITHHGRALGVYQVFLSTMDNIAEDELDELLITLGQNLGMCIDKIHLEQEERKRLIVDERNIIANELHDSLAQTLASLRFQVRVLDETLQPMSEYGSILGIERVENSLDEAYTDLRELIAHCRAPVEQQGLLPSIEALSLRFRKETGIHLLLQSDNEIPDLPVNLEIHVYRIVQEALTNIRKHAEAHIVRVLLKCSIENEYYLLIEDDGKGFTYQPARSKHGEHIGLTIMKERARHLGGQLRIESDSDEGTRIELVFTHHHTIKHKTAHPLPED